MKARISCLVPDCKNRAVAKDLCNNHYQKHRKLLKKDKIDVEPQYLDMSPAALRAKYAGLPKLGNGVSEEEDFFWERLRGEGKLIHPDQE